MLRRELRCVTCRSESQDLRDACAMADLRRAEMAGVYLPRPRKGREPNPVRRAGSSGSVHFIAEVLVARLASTFY